jgi:hypothetical protein
MTFKEHATFIKEVAIIFLYKVDIFVIQYFILFHECVPTKFSIFLNLRQVTMYNHILCENIKEYLQNLSPLGLFTVSYFPKFLKSPYTEVTSF